MPDVVANDGTFDHATGAPLPVLYKDVLGDGTRYARASSVVGVDVSAAIGTWTNRSGNIAAGGTAQVAMAANAARKAWFFQNIGSADLWISFVGTAVVDATGSIKVPAGSSAWSSGGFVSSQALSVIGATTGQKYTAYEG